MQIPNGALREQLEYDGSDLPDSVYEQLATATEMYYRFDANLEQKKKAINILADILESEREEVKDTLNAEYEVPKNEHDKLIFGDRKSTRLNSSHSAKSRMPSSA